MRDSLFSSPVAISIKYVICFKGQGRDRVRGRVKIRDKVRDPNLGLS